MNLHAADCASASPGAPCTCGLPTPLSGPEPSPAPASAASPAARGAGEGRVLPFKKIQGGLGNEGVPASPPVKTMGDALREFTRRYESGEFDPARTYIMIPIDNEGTGFPMLVGESMGTAHLVGRLEVAKFMLIDQAIDSGD